MQIARSAAQQRIDRDYRFRTAQLFHFVEREHARCAVALQRADQQVDPVLGLTVRRGRYLFTGALAPLARHIEGRDAGLLEGQGEIGRDRPRPVLFVEREPGDDHASFSQLPAATGEQSRLAEAARRVQQRETSPRQRAPFLHFRTPDIALNGVR